MDGESGLYYYRARYYDAKMGRFVSKYPVSGSVDAPITQHPYVYCGNNPVNWRDPEGESSVEVGIMMLPAMGCKVQPRGFWTGGSSGGYGQLTGTVVGATAGGAAGSAVGGEIGMSIGFSIGGVLGLGTGPLGSLGGGIAGGIVGGAFGGFVGGIVGGQLGGIVGGFFDPCEAGKLY